MIKIYTTEGCSWCTKTKKYLQTKNIDFEEFNIKNDQKAREEMVKKSNQMAVPVLDVDGEIIIGFDKIAIDKALNL